MPPAGFELAIPAN